MPLLNNINEKYPQIGDVYNLTLEENQSIIADSIITELHSISEKFYTLWHKYLKFLDYFNSPFVQKFQQEMVQQIKERWGESMFRDNIATTNLSICSDENEGKSHLEIAQKLRKTQYYSKLPPFPLHDINLFPPPEKHPVVFDSIYTLNSTQTKREIPKGIHLFVLVHGLQGSSKDLCYFKNNVAVYLNNHQQSKEYAFLCSAANEFCTNGNIADMGRNLARELSKYLEENTNIGRISFIGHSLGGLIIRAALPYLSKFKHQM